MNGLSSDHAQRDAEHGRQPDGQELARLEGKVGAGELAREVRAPVALLDDAVEVGHRGRGRDALAERLPFLVGVRSVGSADA